ncbi:unnamed protein product [Amoebophrya sp. A25]|nr:unnamed protein product [Amoebophrya sp. A25]|eukprot:GSA25T00001144001.1
MASWKGTRTCIADEARRSTRCTPESPSRTPVLRRSTVRILAFTSATTFRHSFGTEVQSANDHGANAALSSRIRKHDESDQILDLASKLLGTVNEHEGEGDRRSLESLTAEERENRTKWIAVGAMIANSLLTLYLSLRVYRAERAEESQLHEEFDTKTWVPLTLLDNNRVTRYTAGHLVRKTRMTRVEESSRKSVTARVAMSRRITKAMRFEKTSRILDVVNKLSKSRRSRAASMHHTKLTISGTKLSISASPAASSVTFAQQEEHSPEAARARHVSLASSRGVITPPPSPRSGSHTRSGSAHHCMLSGHHDGEVEAQHLSEVVPGGSASTAEADADLLRKKKKLPAIKKKKTATRAEAAEVQLDKKVTEDEGLQSAV